MRAIKGQQVTSVTVAQPSIFENNFQKNIKFDLFRSYFKEVYFLVKAHHSKIYQLKCYQIKSD